MLYFNQNACSLLPFDREIRSNMAPVPGASGHMQPIRTLHRRNLCREMDASCSRGMDGGEVVSAAKPRTP